METLSPQQQSQRPSDSSKTSFSDRGTINGVTMVKDGTATVTTSSDRRDISPSQRLPAKLASPSWYIESPRQHIRNDTADIEASVFASLYPKERAKSSVTGQTVSEGEIGGRIPTLPATPKNI